MRLMRLREVLDTTGLSRSALYNLMDEGRFPRPAKLGSKLNGWADTEIQDWIKEQLAARV